jgi:hypothetical protein
VHYHPVRHFFITIYPRSTHQMLLTFLFSTHYTYSNCNCIEWISITFFSSIDLSMNLLWTWTFGSSKRWLVNEVNTFTPPHLIYVLHFITNNCQLPRALLLGWHHDDVYSPCDKETFITKILHHLIWKHAIGLWMRVFFYISYNLVNISWSHLGVKYGTYGWKKRIF